MSFIKKTIIIIINNNNFNTYNSFNNISKANINKYIKTYPGLN
jgi:hypothetical protein